ncbi:unnamed protein product [Arctogadus glacialis]
MEMYKEASSSSLKDLDPLDSKYVGATRSVKEAIVFLFGCGRAADTDERQWKQLQLNHTTGMLTLGFLDKKPASSSSKSRLQCSG